MENYKGNKINILENNKQLNEISEKLAFIEKEDSDDYNLCKQYFITPVKKGCH